MGEGSVLSIYMPRDLKQRWTEHCQRQGETPSAGIRQVVVHLLSSASPSPGTAEIVCERADRSRRRVELRLTASEVRKVGELAQAQGLSTNQWVASLVRAHLTAQPQFGMAELSALGESSTRLLAIGRNLNQIARCLNTGDGAASVPTAEQIRALSGFIKGHAMQVTEVIRANIERWELK